VAVRKNEFVPLATVGKFYGTITPDCRLKLQVPRFCEVFVLSVTVTPAEKLPEEVDPEIPVRDETQVKPPSPDPAPVTVSPLFPDAVHPPPPAEVVPEISVTAKRNPPSAVSSTCTPQLGAAQ